MEQPRTEEDLRAAFALAAQDAPAASQVLAKVQAANARAAARSSRYRIRRWSPLAAVAAVAIAVGVPVGIALSGNGHHDSSSSAGGAVYDVGSNATAAAPEATGAGAAAGGAGGVGGPIAAAPAATPPRSFPSAGRTCAPADLTMVLTWASGSTGLTGVLEVRNRTTTTCDLAVKPGVYPLDAAGKRLPVQVIASAEGYIGPQRLLAGAIATSTISWPSWCGEKAGSIAEVGWGAGVGTVELASGPTTPACTSGVPTDISSEWFTPLS